MGARREVRRRDHDALARAMTLEATNKITHFGQGNGLVGIEPLCLNVNDVEAEFVLLDDAIDTSVADPAKRSAHLDSSAAVAHTHQEIDDEAFEERRTKRMNPTDDVARQFGVKQLKTRSDRLLRVVPRLGFLGRLNALALGAPGDEFRIAFQDSEVDVAHALGQQLTASIGGATVAAPRQLD